MLLTGSEDNVGYEAGAHRRRRHRRAEPQPGPARRPLAGPAGRARHRLGSARGGPGGAAQRHAGAWLPQRRAAVERAGIVVGRFGYYDQRGEPLCDIDLGGLWSAVGPFVGIRRAALHDVLRSGPDRYRLGTAVTGGAGRPACVGVVQRRDDGRVRPGGRRGRHQLRRPAPRLRRAHAGLRRARWPGAAWRRSDRARSTASSSGWARTGSSDSARSATT